MNILYIGSAGPLSFIPLRALVESEHNVCAFAFDDNSKSDFNITTSDSIQALALSHFIPLIKLDEIQLYEPDVILVSCYARRLPQSILSLAKKAIFNIHPSLLPKFRGPAPIFWQLRQGIKHFGVTIHLVTEEFDAGNIVSQQKVNMPDGINLNTAMELLANVASELLLKILDDIEHISETRQNNELASYQSFPKESDYTVSTLWPAKRIYNFINAYKGSGISFLCEIEGEEFKLVDAYSYQEKPYENMNGVIAMLEGEEITFACLNSYVRCEISRKSVRPELVEG